MKYSIVSGYFDPIHKGHIEYFQLAKKQGDKLLVILNNDKQAILKKGKSFMNENDRNIIINAIGVVDETIISIDTDLTQCETLLYIRKMLPNDELVFCQGGDRNNNEIPEAHTCRLNDIKMIDGLGDKIESSSNLIKKSK